MAARSALGKIAKAERALAARCGGTAPNYETLRGGDAGPFAAAWQSLNDDLNTAEAPGQLFVTLKSLMPGTPSPEEAAAAHRGLHFMLAAFGFILPEPEEPEAVPDDVRAVADRRWVARTAKNWPEGMERRTRRGWEESAAVLEGDEPAVQGRLGARAPRGSDRQIAAALRHRCSPAPPCRCSG